MHNAKIRVGIIGAGRMGITHFSIINSHPNVAVTAVADTSTVVNSLLAKYLKVNTYKEYQQLLEKEALDALLVCTPPFLNHDILSMSLQRRLHAFVEKPYTMSAEEGAELAGKYTAMGLVNQVGYVNRFNDVFVKLKSLLAQGVIGRVLRFRSEMYSRTIVREEEGSGWRATRSSGGGVVYEMAAHSIDLINYLFGPPKKIAGTCLSRVFSKEVEDIVSSSFIYDDGTVGSLYVNWSDESFRKPTNKIEVFGRGGKLLADQHGLRIHLNAGNEVAGFRPGWNSLYITDVFQNVPFFVRGNEFTAQLYHFIECIQTRQIRPRCTFADATATLAVIESMLADHASLREGLR